MAVDLAVLTTQKCFFFWKHTDELEYVAFMVKCRPYSYIKLSFWIHLVQRDRVIAQNIRIDCRYKCVYFAL